MRRRGGEPAAPSSRRLHLRSEPWDGIELAFTFKQSNFSFMIPLHHPRLQLPLPALSVSAICAELCDGVRRPFLVLPPNQSFSLDAAVEHQKWLSLIDCSECFLIHFDKASLAAAAAS